MRRICFAFAVLLAGCGRERETQTGEDNAPGAPAAVEQPQVGRTSRVRTVKPRMNYWWDFCPRMVHVGIWDDVHLEVTGPVRITDVFVRPQLSDDFGRADVSVTIELDSAIQGVVDLEITLRQEGSFRVNQWTHHDLTIGPTRLDTCIELESPHLWWPNGYGEQELYEATVRILFSTDDISGHLDISAVRTISFGIRQVNLVQNESADPSALPYTFVVNGRKIYVKGWNWVPMDVMYSVPQPAKVERLMMLAKRAHVNLLRVWGGGLIEKDSFYDQCDRLGIMVWQEFIQSSSGIGNTPSAAQEYVQMVREAAEEIVPRKRNHPSLALWCGGNELSDETEQPLDDTHPVLAALKTTVNRLDPDRLALAAQGRGLLESGVAAVENYRLPLLELMVEDRGQTGIPPLRHPRRLLGGVALGRIEENPEVLRVEHFELERFVLDLVAAEVLGVGGEREAGQSGKDNEGPQEGSHGLCYPG